MRLSRLGIILAALLLVGVGCPGSTGGYNIKEDFCGIGIGYMYCKCAFHGEYCEDIGMSRSKANKHVQAEFKKWVKARRERANANANVSTEDLTAPPPGINYCNVDADCPDESCSADGLQVLRFACKDGACAHAGKGCGPTEPCSVFGGVAACRPKTDPDHPLIDPPCATDADCPADSCYPGDYGYNTFKCEEGVCKNHGRGCEGPPGQPCTIFKGVGACRYTGKDAEFKPPCATDTDCPADSCTPGDFGYNSYKCEAGVCQNVGRGCEGPPGRPCTVFGGVAACRPPQDPNHPLIDPPCATDADCPADSCTPGDYGYNTFKCEAGVCKNEGRGCEGPPGMPCTLFNGVAACRYTGKDAEFKPPCATDADCPKDSCAAGGYGTNTYKCEAGVCANKGIGCEGPPNKPCTVFGGVAACRASNEQACVTDSDCPTATCSPSGSALVRFACENHTCRDVSTACPSGTACLPYNNVSACRPK